MSEYSDYSVHFKVSLSQQIVSTQGTTPLTPQAVDEEAVENHHFKEVSKATLSSFLSVQVRRMILDAWGWCTGTTQRDGMGREEGSGWGTHVYLWRIHFDIWQN